MVYLFLVYGVVWLGFFAYLFYLLRRERDLAREMANLRESLARQEGGAWSHRSGPESLQ